MIEMKSSFDEESQWGKITWDGKNERIGLPFLEALLEAKRELSEKVGLKGILFGPKAGDFGLGLDAQELKQHDNFESLYAYQQALNALLLEIEGSKVPVVALLRGRTFGAALELALAAHIRIAIEGASLQLGVERLGEDELPPGLAGIQRLSRIVGVSKAETFLLNGAPSQAEEALALGLLRAIVPNEEAALKEAQALAETLSSLVPWYEKGFTYPGASPKDGRLRDGLVMAAAAIVKKGGSSAEKAVLSSLQEGAMVDFPGALKIDARYFLHEASRQKATL